MSLARRYPLAGPVLGACLSLGLAWPAAAADWSLTGRTALTIEADTNRDLDVDSDGPVYGATTTAGLTLGVRTEQLTISLSAGAEGALFGGPGDTSELTRLEPGDVAATLGYTGKTYTFGARASFAIDPTSVTQIEDTGLTDTDTSQLTTRAGVDLTLRLDERTDALFGATADLIDFAESADGLEPTRTYGVSTGLRRELTRTTTGTATLGLRHFSADNAEETRSQTLDLSAGLDHRRTSRHTVGVTGGVTAVRTVEIGQGTEFDLGATGGLRFGYRLQNLTFELDASQAIDPSSEGELQAFTRVGGTLGYAINARERFSLATALSRGTPLSGDTASSLTFTTGPTYTLALTEQTALSLGYQFRLSQDEDAGAATGHQVFLTLERRFTLLP
jgi:hypothetical protein